ncbi:hypothetical protein SAMN05216499_106316 [Actinacidiphila paucisporea]|uniref:Uncharacterized protein n=1 Tax=Actinacidiphila paucisporea TaxID=310782 RepID=A0A1M7E787_9ACTN|nr:hypothetical protein SAMN05216499_106316 [Actinacidiphila paucisporea]
MLPAGPVVRAGFPVPPASPLVSPVPGGPGDVPSPRPGVPEVVPGPAVAGPPPGGGPVLVVGGTPVAGAIPDGASGGADVLTSRI